MRLIAPVIFFSGLSVLLAIQLRPPLLHPNTLSALPARLTALALELQPTAPPMQQAAAAGGRSLNVLWAVVPLLLVVRSISLALTPPPRPFCFPHAAALRLALQAGLRPEVLLDALLLGQRGEQLCQSFKPIINRCARNGKLLGTHYEM